MRGDLQEAGIEVPRLNGDLPKAGIEAPKFKGVLSLTIFSRQRLVLVAVLLATVSGSRYTSITSLSVIFHLRSLFLRDRRENKF